MNDLIRIPDIEFTVPKESSGVLLEAFMRGEQISLRAYVVFISPSRIMDGPETVRVTLRPTGAPELQRNNDKLLLQAAMLTSWLGIKMEDNWLGAVYESINRAYQNGLKRAKCDGNHVGPRCGDPECWNQ